MTDAPKTLTDDKLREAIGRAWCHEGNTHKVVDPDLAEAVIYEVRAALVEQAAPAGVPEWDYFQGLVNSARKSAAKAKIKFPQPNYVTLKIAEEAGEVVRGAVHYAEGRMEWDEVQGEIIQLLAMLIRFVTEGDGVNGVIPPELVRRVPPAHEPDPTPALSWKAMQTAAAECVSLARNGEADTDFRSIIYAILALPGPTDADLDCEALNRPVVREFAHIMRMVMQISDRSTPLWGSAWAALAKIGGDA